MNAEIDGSQDAMSLGVVFSKSFYVFRRGFWPIVVVMAVIAVIDLSIQDITKSIQAAAGTNPGEQVKASLESLGISLLSSLLQPLFQAILVCGVIRILQNRSFDLKGSVAVMIRRLPTLVLIAVVFGIVVFVGLIALLIPGVIASLMYLVASPVCVIEGTGIGASFARSRQLTKSYRWRILFIIILPLVCAILLGLGIKAGFSAEPYVGYAVQVAYYAISAGFFSVLYTVICVQLRLAKDGVPVEGLIVPTA